MVETAVNVHKKKQKKQNIDTMGAMLYRSSIERWEIAIETSMSNYFYDDQFFGSSIIVDYAHSSRVYSTVVVVNGIYDCD